MSTTGVEVINIGHNQFDCDCGMHEAREFFLSASSKWARDVGVDIVCSDETNKGQKLVETKVLPCEAPQITGISESSEVEKGRTVLLRCIAKGKPVPQISWIAPNEDVYRFESDNFEGVSVSENGELRIEQLDEKDSGDYVCQAASTDENGKDKLVQVKTKLTIIDNDNNPHNNNELHRGDLQTDNFQKSHLQEDQFCPKYCDCQDNHVDCSYPRYDDNDHQIQKLSSIPKIPKLAQGVTHYTHTFNLAGNAIRDAERRVCDQFDIIDEINLSENKLTLIEAANFEGCSKLKHLNLKANQISSLSKYSFNQMDALTLINLDDNEIREIDVEVFKNLPVLKWVYLKNNRIHNVVPGAFQFVPEIHFLHLDNNFLEGVNYKFIRSLRDENRNVEILMRDNPFVCDCRMAPLLNEYKNWHDTVMQFDDLICQQPLRHRGVEILSLKPENLIECGEGYNEEYYGTSNGTTTLKVLAYIIFIATLIVVCFYGYKKYERGQIIRNQGYADAQAWSAAQHPDPENQPLQEENREIYA